MRKSGLTGDEAYALSKRRKTTEDLGPLKKEIGSIKEDIDNLNDKKITKFYASNLGETHITDSDDGKIQDMMIYGKSSQDGTPSPENPVEIKSVVNPHIWLQTYQTLVTLITIIINTRHIFFATNIKCQQLVSVMITLFI